MAPERGKNDNGWADPAFNFIADWRERPPRGDGVRYAWKC